MIVAIPVRKKYRYQLFLPSAVTDFLSIYPKEEIIMFNLKSSIILLIIIVFSISGVASASLANRNIELSDNKNLESQYASVFIGTLNSDYPKYDLDLETDSYLEDAILDSNNTVSTIVNLEIDTILLVGLVLLGLTLGRKHKYY